MWEVNLGTVVVAVLLFELIASLWAHAFVNDAKYPVANQWGV